MGDLAPLELFQNLSMLQTIREEFWNRFRTKIEYVVENVLQISHMIFTIVNFNVK